MLEIKGYEIEGMLHTGNLFCVYQGIRKTDSQKVILKTTSSEQPELNEIAVLHHEYELLKRLHSPDIIQVYDLITHYGKPVLILEDFEGISLSQFLSGKAIGLKEFFTIALHITDALHAIYCQNIIHKDISPHNIIIHRNTLKTKLIDFGLASQFVQESQDFTQRNSLEGTLAYISPEQTGRTNRLVDYRTDFYSLGITFYQLLTGRVPFQSDDTLELVYQHLAAIPPAVHEVNPNIPVVVSKIVSKLLSKIPEERYISAIGIKEDLKKCQQEWNDTGTISHFPIAQKDIYDRLLISQKIYGRENQIQSLLNAFDRVINGSKEIFLISGYSGIGKTSLVKEIYRPITRQRGYFIKGKYDQLQRSVPYSAFIEAFKEMIHRLLSESEEQLNVMRNMLLQALGNNGQVIADVIPDILLIIGAQPPVPKLPPQESQNRFMFTFQSFIRVFAQPHHPLVVFLDDLQWADNASLNFLKIILGDTDLHHFFIVGAYRENEVDNEHPLMAFQKEIKDKGISLNHLSLHPLDKKDIQQLLADSLNCEMKQVESLAVLLTEKTHGNPFFIGEILKKLYRNQVIVFSHEECRWRWDMERIYHEDITDNVVDLLLDQFHRLSLNTQNALKLAACIGHVFTLKTLSTISRRTYLEAASDLLEAIQLNLIRPLGEYVQLLEWLKGGFEIRNPEKITYRFNHDRIQQSAYQLIEDAERSYIHLAIGRLFVLDEPLQEKDERLFDVLHHFNQSILFITDTNEKLMIAEANLWAGRKAKEATAYHIACNYFQSGVELLPYDHWKHHYSLSFALHIELAECEFLTANLQAGNEHLAILLKQSKTIFDQIDVYAVQLSMFEMSGKIQEAINVGAHALSLLGVQLPLTNLQWHLFKYFIKIKCRIGFRNIQDIELHPLTDAHQKKVYGIVHKLYSFVYFFNENLFALLLSFYIHSSLKYGYDKNTSSIYLMYAFVNMHLLKNYKGGIAFIHLAEKMIQEVGNNAMSLFLLGGFIAPWKESFDHGQQKLMSSSQHAVEAGDLYVLTLSALFFDYLSQIKGDALSTVLEKLDHSLSLYDKLHYRSCKIILQEMKNTNLLLREPSNPDLTQLPKLNVIIESLKNKTEIVNVCVVYARFYYILNAFDLALRASEEYEVYAQFNMGAPTHAEGKFYHGLTLFALYDKADHKKKALYKKKIAAICKQFKVWDSWCAENWRPFERLLAAELARINHRFLEAMSCYDEAIALAEEKNILYLIGIASECAARFYLGIGKQFISKFYFQKSNYSYTCWGAAAKIQQLESQYDGLLEFRSSSSSLAQTSFTEKPSSTTISSIDILSILKSTQAIMSEIRIDHLLQKLLIVLLHNTGAQRGMLIMKENNAWLVKAEGTADVQHVIIDRIEKMNDRKDIPFSLINYVLRTHERLLIQDDESFDQYMMEDVYLAQVKPKSLLIIPISYQGQIHTILYLENKTVSHAFTPEHRQTLNLLASQAAISLENARLYHQATHDPLTGLANRNLLYQLFEYRKKLRDRDTSIAIIFLDLDGFKKINDTLGHEIGDKLLLKFSEIIKQCLREGDLPVRLGGDEFVIMLEFKSDAQPAEVAKRILEKVKRPVYIEGHEIYICTSIGITVSNQSEAELHIQELLKQADIALYHVKNAGKGHYYFYTPELDVYIKRENSDEIALRAAIELNQLSLYFQPIFNQHMKLTSFEALLRWKHPKQGLIAAKNFIPLAEKSGLILAIGEWVLIEAANQIKRWEQEAFTPVPIAVNISGLQLKQQNLIALLKSILKKRKFTASYLELEITESIFIEITDTIIADLNRLKKLGVQLTIDDFGTHYSSLSYLHHLPVDKIKIDQSFIKGMQDNEKHRSLVASVISMAHKLNLKVVAEGVENKIQMELLKEYDVDELQGYYFSYPLNVAESTQLLAEKQHDLQEAQSV